MTPPTDLSKIRKSLEAFRAAITELSTDRTEHAAREALAAAQAAAAAAQADDPTAPAEAIIDARLEAQRAVSIAELRLARAENELFSRQTAAAELLAGPSKIMLSALAEAAPEVESNLLGKLRELLGADFEQLKGQLGSVAHNRGRRLIDAGMRIRNCTTAQDLAANLAIAANLLENTKP